MAQGVEASGFVFAGSWTGAAAYWDHDLESHIDGSAGGTVGNYLRVGTNTGWRGVCQ